MKKLGAQLHKIVAAALALVIALGVASFACYAWFTSSKEVNSDGITATVDEAFITDYKFEAYPLTETTTSSTYTQGSAIEANKDDTSKNYGYYEIGEYGTSTSATLLVISYTVRDGSATKLTFSGNAFTKPSYDETTDVITTDLSNAVSLRLGTLSGTTVSSSATARVLYDVTVGVTYDENSIIGNKQDAVFTTSGASVTLYFIMEYDDDAVAALYDMSGASLSAGLSLTKDITLSIEPYDSAEDHEHTYSKWTVTASDDTSYTYKATRSCTDSSCDNSDGAKTQTVYFSDTTTISGSIVMASGTYDGIAYSIVFNTYSSSDSGSASTATVSSVSLSASTASLTVGETLSLTATVTMSDSSTYSGDITWTSSDSTIASVSGSATTCTVTGVAAGTVTITATAGGESATCTVTVTAASGSTSTTYTYSISDYYSSLSGSIGTSQITLYFGDSDTVSTSSTSYILAYATSASGTASSVSDSGFLTTGGATNSSNGIYGRYFTINLSNYSGYTVSISVKMSATGSGSDRNMILTTAYTSTSTTADTTLKYGTTSSTTAATWSYEGTVSTTPLYLTCDASIRVYSIEITLTPAS